MSNASTHTHTHTRYFSLCLFAWKSNKIKIAPICESVLSRTCITHAKGCCYRYVSCVLCLLSFFDFSSPSLSLPASILFVMYKKYRVHLYTLHRSVRWMEYFVQYMCVRVRLYCLYGCAFVKSVYSSFLLWIVCIPLLYTQHERTHTRTGHSVNFFRFVAAAVVLLYFIKFSVLKISDQFIISSCKSRKQM